MPKAKVKETKMPQYAEHVVPVLPGTPEMEALLRPAYNMTVEEAEQLLRDREANPAAVPWEEVKRAKALLAAYHSRAQATSKTPGWKRGPRPM